MVTTNPFVIPTKLDPLIYKPVKNNFNGQVNVQLQKTKKADFKTGLILIGAIVGIILLMNKQLKKLID